MIVSHRKVSKLHFYKCAHFLLFLFVSTFFIHHFHSYAKILNMIPLIPTPNSPHSDPYSLHSHPDSLYFHHSHPDPQHSQHSPHSVPKFLILDFTDSVLCIIFKTFLIKLLKFVFSRAFLLHHFWNICYQVIE